VKAFWDMASCSVVELDLSFRGACNLLHQGDEILMMEAERSSETSVNFYDTIRRHISEGSHLHTFTLRRSTSVYNAATWSRTMP
jgi:hypothetical protein